MFLRIHAVAFHIAAISSVLAHVIRAPSLTRLPARTGGQRLQQGPAVMFTNGGVQPGTSVAADPFLDCRYRWTEPVIEGSKVVAQVRPFKARNRFIVVFEASVVVKDLEKGAQILGVFHREIELAFYLQVGLFRGFLAVMGHLAVMHHHLHSAHELARIDRDNASRCGDKQDEEESDAFRGHFNCAHSSPCFGRRWILCERLPGTR